MSGKIESSEELIKETVESPQPEGHTKRHRDSSKKKTIQQTEIRLQEKFQPQREIQAIQGVAAKAISAEANDRRGT